MGSRSPHKWRESAEVSVTNTACLHRYKQTLVLAVPCVCQDWGTSVRRPCAGQGTQNLCGSFVMQTARVWYTFTRACVLQAHASRLCPSGHVSGYTVGSCSPFAIGRVCCRTTQSLCGSFVMHTARVSYTLTRAFAHVPPCTSFAPGSWSYRPMCHVAYRRPCDRAGSGLV